MEPSMDILNSHQTILLRAAARCATAGPSNRSARCRGGAARAARHENTGTVFQVPQSVMRGAVMTAPASQ